MPFGFGELIDSLCVSIQNLLPDRSIETAQRRLHLLLNSRIQTPRMREVRFEQHAVFGNLRSYVQLDTFTAG